MAPFARPKSRRRPRPHAIHKPNGTLHPRVQAVGPERFGILSVDCAKARSKIMLADFYGRVLIPPTVIEHNQADLDAAVRLLHEALVRHGLKDHIVAVELFGEEGGVDHKGRAVQRLCRSKYRAPERMGDHDMVANFDGVQETSSGI